MTDITSNGGNVTPYTRKFNLDRSQQPQELEICVDSGNSRSNKYSELLPSWVGNAYHQRPYLSQSRWVFKRLDDLSTFLVEFRIPEQVDWANVYRLLLHS